MTLPDLGFNYRWEPANPTSNKTLLLLHGTGGTENDLLDLGKLVAPDFNLLSPRGKVLENGMARFFKRKSVGVFDVEDLKHRAIELGQFIKNAVKELGLKNHQMIALGYSNGANIATGIIFQDPDLLQGAVLLRPMIPYDPGQIPLAQTKILMISGTLDSTMPADEPEKLEALLKSNQAKVNLHILSASHGLTTEDIKITKQWIKDNF